MEKLKNEIEDLLQQWCHLDFIKTEDIPNIDLYMDQVTTFMDENLSDTKRSETDKILTKTMINNYTKNNLLPPSNKKKYSKEHILLLIFIYYYKNTLSIQDIQRVLKPLAESFYNKDDNLEDIYTTIFDVQKNSFKNINIDIKNKIEEASTTFETDTDNEELLFLFSLISSLSMEVFIKKHMIEQIIDNYFVPKEKNKD